MPVCIDRSYTYKLYNEPKASGTVVGWGITEHGELSEVLREGKFNYYNFNLCRSMASPDFQVFITSDKFCAGLPNETTLGQGDSGAGLTFQKVDKDIEINFIYGIVSFRSETNHSIVAFTNISEHFDWLDDILITIIRRDRAEISALQEKERQNRCTVNHFECMNGQCIKSSSVCDGTVDCVDNSDETNATCSKLDIKVDWCYLPEKPRNGDYSILGCPRKSECTKGEGSYVKPSVVLKYSCDKGYALPINITYIVCDQGQWEPKPQDCKNVPAIFALEGEKRQTNLQSCGIQNKNVTSITNEYPWATAIYLAKNHGYLCGGSIISPKAILTAAHCVYHDRKKTLISTNEVEVIVGKYRSSWAVQDPHEQRFKVAEILIKDTYKGGRSRFQDDIAVLRINGTIIISSLVMPVCIDISHTSNLYNEPKDVGTLAAWGKTEQGEISEVLKVVIFHYDSFKNCHSKASPDFQVFITSDKFCAEVIYGTLDQGDGGAGLTFQKDDNDEEVHFIHGIASIGDNSTITFTNVSAHVEWLDNVGVL